MLFDLIDTGNVSLFLFLDCANGKSNPFVIALSILIWTAI